jgi:hypothetical protein
MPVVFGVPLPADTDPSLTGELTGILNQLANTGKVSDKGYLIEGGLPKGSGGYADAKLKDAAAKGYLPLSFNLTPPEVNGNTATTTVTATSPAASLPAQQLTFVNSGGWKLSRASALAIVSALQG